MKGRKSDAAAGEPGKVTSDRNIDETLNRFRLQTGLDAASPILSFMRLALKASAPVPRPDRQRSGPVPPQPDLRSPMQQDTIPNEPIEPSSYAWLIVMLAAALIGLLFSWLAKTGTLN